MGCIKNLLLGFLFFLEPTGKKLGQAFFHKKNISGVIGRFRPLLGTPEMQILSIFTKHSIFWQKQLILVKKKNY